MADENTARERLETAHLAAAARGRTSVRKYLPDPVPRDDVRAMVEFAVRAANAGNAQIWRFAAVDDAGTRAELGGAVDARLEEMLTWPELAGMEAQVKGLRAHAAFFPKAPVVVAVSSLPYSSVRRQGAGAARHPGRRTRSPARPPGPPVHRRRGADASRRRACDGLRRLLDVRTGDRGAGHRTDPRHRVAGTSGCTRADRPPRPRREAQAQATGRRGPQVHLTWARLSGARVRMRTPMRATTIQRSAISPAVSAPPGCYARTRSLFTSLSNGEV